MRNERWPHTLTVKRGRLDVNGDPVLDTNGNPVYDTVSLSVVKTVDGEPQRDANGSFVTTTATSISFGYRTTTRNSKTEGDVAVSDFTLSCPMFTTELKYGDVLEMTDYDKSCRCTVIKKANSNWGSNIWCNLIRN